jgi:hypothetical protein
MIPGAMRRDSGPRWGGNSVRVQIRFGHDPRLVGGCHVELSPALVGRQGLRWPWIGRHHPDMVVGARPRNSCIYLILSTRVYCQLFNGIDRDRPKALAFESSYWQYRRGPTVAGQLCNVPSSAACVRHISEFSRPDADSCSVMLPQAARVKRDSVCRSFSINPQPTLRSRRAGLYSQE